MLKKLIGNNDKSEPVIHQFAKLILGTAGAFVMQQMIEVYYDHIRTTHQKDNE